MDLVHTFANDLSHEDVEKGKCKAAKEVRDSQTVTLDINAACVWWNAPTEETKTTIKKLMPTTTKTIKNPTKTVTTKKTTTTKTRP